jgi:hypothetical protein
VAVEYVRLDPRHEVAHVLPQIDPVSILGGHDDRPHQFVVPLPISDHGCDVEVISSGIKAEASTNFTVGWVPRQIARCLTRNL